MKGRIRLSLCYVGILAALFSAYFTAKVLEESMVEQLQSALRQRTNLIEAAYVKLDSAAQLKNFASDSLRITLIQKDGQVLFESDAETEKMSNHLSRPEVAAAFERGYGESRRYSITLKASVFYGAKKLSDGNVLRLGMRQANLQYYISKTTPYLLGLIAVIIVVSILIAFALSRFFIQPIQKLAEKINDPDFFEEDCIYPEIAPFVKVIRKRNRELEVTIEKLHQEEQKMVQIKDEFTANAAHELKTPLTTISGYAEMIEAGMVKPEDVQKFAGKILGEAGRMQSIVNDIMTLSKLDKPGENSVPVDSSVDLLEVAKNCTDALSINAIKKGVELTCSGISGTILGNEPLIFEMIYNLVDNSIRYTDDGGNVQVLVGESSVTVRDNGIGIPEDCKERIFERFFRVDKSHSRETGGTGLGLAIVKHIAQVHGARILLDSTIGKGTSVQVIFG